MGLPRQIQRVLISLEDYNSKHAGKDWLFLPEKHQFVQYCYCSITYDSVHSFQLLGDTLCTTRQVEIGFTDR